MFDYSGTIVWGFSKFDVADAVFCKPDWDIDEIKSDSACFIDGQPLNLVMSTIESMAYLGLHEENVMVSIGDLGSIEILLSVNIAPREPVQQRLDKGIPKDELNYTVIWRLNG